MPKIIKFFYQMILFISLILVVPDVTGKHFHILLNFIINLIHIFHPF
jgi:hypothetical protein